MKQISKKIVVAILTWEARLLLRRTRPTIVAVTGSVGKTGTKDAIYTALRHTYRVRKSEKSYNSEIGIPLTILGLKNGWSNPFAWLRILLAGAFIASTTRSYPEIVVLEAGVDTPGDMERLTQWLRPDVVVLTRLPDVPVHVEYFSSPAAVIAEKMRLVYALSTNGVLVYNHDDVLITEQLPTVRHTQIGYGRYSDTQYRIEKDQTVYHDDVPTGVSFTLRDAADEQTAVTVSGSIGMQNVYIYAAAIAVAGHFNIPAAEAAKHLYTHLPPPGRMRVLPGIKGSVIIDDTYNSSPVAAESALQTLGELKYSKRKIAVLGDMLELGQYSIEQHQRIGTIVPRVADILITIGVRSRETAMKALEHGMSESAILQYDDVSRAGRELQTLLQPGDTVLVKGSQAIRAEQVVQEVMHNPEQTEELLVRQSRAWQSR